MSTVTLDLSEAGAVGIERSGRSSGNPSATWLVSCLEGTLAVSSKNDKKSFAAPVVLAIDSSGNLESRDGVSPPAWLGESEPDPADREIRDQFLRCFHPGRPVLAEIVTATEDTRDPIRRLAISALTTLGDLSYVMPLLDRMDAPAIRRDTIAALREYMVIGPDAARQLREQIVEEFGETTGPIVEKLLIGYTPEEAAQPGTLQRLVGYLEPDTPSVGMRELSLDNLMKLTGRDRLGYDPDKPEEGLENWKKLLSEGKLIPNPKPPSGNESDRP
jgi:hypothetical protein